ncbi:hypothetical protein GGR57DRAFT_500817 [Xylariaceae sp. FL1272]|nr:hypothetical protein GGR57DRAFT_500817 [Xylariaceae sp. FL1272]
MRLRQLFLAATSLCFIAASAPVNDHEYPGFAILDQYPSEDGAATITVYGNANKTASSNLARRKPPKDRTCGENFVTCRSTDLADRAACRYLYETFKHDGKLVPYEPKAVCARFKLDNCCATWAGEIELVTRKMLYPAASKMWHLCKGDTGLSAFADNVLLGEICTRQCVSSRPGDCEQPDF